MTKFTYNNMKNTSTGYSSFDLNYGVYPRVFYKKDVDPCSKSKAVDEPVTKFRERTNAYQENLHHMQEL